MPTVFLPSMLREAAGGSSEHEAAGATVAELLDDLDERFPGLRDRLVDSSGELKGNLAVAVDGEVSPLGLREKVAPDAEVHFVPAISGGRNARPAPKGV